MPIGPKDEKRPADPPANAVHVMRVLTGEAEQTYVDQGKSTGRKAGGKARAASTSPARRSEIAKAAAKARWGG